MSETKPGLYGIKHSNKNFLDPDSWGKNQFNSTFPIALCCYMRDQGYDAMYITMKKGKPIVSKISFNKVFHTKLPNDKLKFLFEFPFVPYGNLVHEALEKIDVVVTEEKSGKFLMPLEIKLTTLPDNGTASLPENEYGSEIVIRSATMRYVALGIAAKLKPRQREDVKQIFQPVCMDVRDWSNVYEMRPRREAMFNVLRAFLQKYESLQQPLVLQPVWKTKGKSPTLADNCLDVFVWSDFALSRLMLTSCDEMGDEISRPQRSALRLIRFLYEYVTQGKVYEENIFDGMLYGHQGDKEFAYRGVQTHRFMACKRLTKPIVRKDEIKNIVLGRPPAHERDRFDLYDFIFKDAS